MDDPALTPALREWLEREKLEAMAEFAAGAGHEINNPVAAIIGRVQLLLPDEADPDRRRQLQTIVAQALRIRDMIGDAMLFARPPAPERVACDLSALVERETEKLREAAAARGTAIEFALHPPAPVFADPIQFAVVVHALVRNSLEALRSGGRVVIDVRTESAERTDEGQRSDDAADSTSPRSRVEWCVLRVTDDGPGLSEKDRRHLFDPYYSGRQAGRGLGFGLSKCWRIVTQHEGGIEVESVPGRTTFTVRLKNDRSTP